MHPNRMEEGDKAKERRHILKSLTKRDFKGCFSFRIVSTNGGAQTSF